MSDGPPDVVRLWPTPEDTQGSAVAVRALRQLVDLVVDGVEDATFVLHVLDALSDDDLAAVQVGAATIADMSSATREARARLGRERRA